MRLRPFSVSLSETPVCLFDVDDVTADLSQLLRPALNVATGLRLPLTDWTSYDLSLHYPLSHEAIQGLVIKQRLLERALPITSTRHLIRHLHAQGAHIHFVTARGFHPAAHSVTTAWMHRHEIPYRSVIVTTHHESKIEACAHLGKVALMMDDCDRHLDQAEASGRVSQLILVDRPWNRGRREYHFKGGETKQRVCVFTRGAGHARDDIRQAYPA